LSVTLTRKTTQTFWQMQKNVEKRSKIGKRFRGEVPHEKRGVVIGDETVDLFYSEQENQQPQGKLSHWENSGRWNGDNLKKC